MNFSERDILEIIREIISPILAPGAHNLLDDGAQLSACAPGMTRVISLDAFQENNDFKIGLGPLESAGHRAIVQNLSDLAAMGAKPVGFLWSLELPDAWLSNNAAYLKNFVSGAVQACQKYNLEFYGGDLSKSPNRFSCAITILGDVAGKPLGRQGARPGDKIYVSRELGLNAAAGYHSIYPVPELELGQKLVGHATACMDISDGLAKDLHRLCRASKVGATLHQVPHPEGVTREQALYGGEDYALLFTAANSEYGIEIGRITKDPQILFEGDPLSEGGFDHFQSVPH